VAALALPGVAGDFAAAWGDLLFCGVADGRATLPLAVLATWIMAEAAAPALAAVPMPTCAALLRPTGCALSVSWPACGWPVPAWE
jgi:hypothetical protein